ncbi:MAG: hypothetical protein PETM_01558 [Petrimonas sp.]
MNFGKTVFAQIMQFIPRREFNEIVTKYKGDYRVRSLSCHDQFLVMCMAQYADKNSLCDIEASLNALAVVRKLYHCGISYAVPRNTLAKANENRDWRIYAELGQVLIKKVRPLYAKDKFRLDIDNMVYAFDSSTISLCLKLCPWAKFRKNKGGVKMHTQIDLRGNIPVFIHLTKASVHDVNAMDEICIEMGAIYLMDKGYIDFFRLFNNIHKNGAFFVTRAKDNMQYEVISSRAVDLQTGVISDQIIRLTEEVSSEKYPDEFRMVVYEDYATGHVYRFITNHTGYEALAIAELYRERWNVELFFYDKYIIMQSRKGSMTYNQSVTLLLLISTSHKNSQRLNPLSHSSKFLFRSHSRSVSILGTRFLYAFSSASRLALESARA